jgi:hypothetical protein
MLTSVARTCRRAPRSAATSVSDCLQSNTHRMGLAKDQEGDTIHALASTTSTPTGSPENPKHLVCIHPYTTSILYARRGVASTGRVVRWSSLACAAALRGRSNGGVWRGGAPARGGRRSGQLPGTGACGLDLGRLGPIWTARAAEVAGRLLAPGSAARRRCSATTADCSPRACAHSSHAGAVRSLRWWWTTMPQRQRQGPAGSLDCVLPVGLVSWCAVSRTKVRTTCVGAGDDGVFGRRFPPWRRRREAPASHPPSGYCLW